MFFKLREILIFFFFIVVVILIIHIHIFMTANIWLYINYDNLYFDLVYSILVYSFTHSRDLHDFLKGICVKWKVNSFVQDLNFAY